MSYACILCGHPDCEAIVSGNVIDVDYSLARRDTALETLDRSYVACTRCGFVSIQPRYTEEELSQYFSRVPVSQHCDDVVENYTGIFYEETAAYLDSICGIKGFKLDSGGFQVQISEGNDYPLQNACSSDPGILFGSVEPVIGW